VLAARTQRLAELDDRLRHAMQARLDALTRRISLIERGLTALSPIDTLARGYAIVTQADDGRLVTESRSVAAGTRIDVQLAEGCLDATVDSVRPDERS
jgi:exodeoxyribonuclease VII large subunit